MNLVKYKLQSQLKTYKSVFKDMTWKGGKKCLIARGKIPPPLPLCVPGDIVSHIVTISICPLCQYISTFTLVAKLQFRIDQWHRKYRTDKYSLKFGAFVVTHNKYFFSHKTLGLLMTYHHTKFACKRTGSWDKQNLFLLYKKTYEPPLRI